MRFSTISPRFGHQLTTLFFLRLDFAGDIKNSFFYVKIASLHRYWSRLLLSWRRVMRFSAISARFGHQLVTFVYSRLVFAGDIKNSFFLSRLLVSVVIGLVCSWVGVARWDFPPYLRGLVISLQRFFFQGSFLQETSKTVYFLYRLLVSVDIGLVCSWVGVAGWDFPPYLRGLVIYLQLLFRQCPFAQQIPETAYFSSRLLVSVVIGLVCSWVGVAGWDFPPYLRGLVINLQLLFFQGSLLQEISKTVFFS